MVAIVDDDARVSTTTNPTTTTTTTHVVTTTTTPSTTLTAPPAAAATSSATSFLAPLDAASMGKKMMMRTTAAATNNATDDDARRRQAAQTGEHEQNRSPQKSAQTPANDDTVKQRCDDKAGAASVADAADADEERILTSPLSSAPDQTPTTAAAAATPPSAGGVDTSVLEKMELLNRMNEADARSVTQVSVSTSGGSAHNSASPPLAPRLRSGGSLDGGATNNNHHAGGGGSETNGDGVAAAAAAIDPDFDPDVDLWTIWGDLVRNWPLEMRRRPNYVKELIRRGIPSHFRTIAWQLLSGAEMGAAAHELYTDYLRRASPYEKTIQRDIPRTFPEMPLFRDGGGGQQSLFNIIKAYSLHDREVGYCQGSAFIAGQLLIHMPEEEAFAVLLRLMEAYRLRELYKPTMTELGLCMFQLEYIVQEQMPDLHMHFVNMGFDTSMYASGWFLALFLTSLPLELANRFMDLFLVDGIDAVFKVALAILQLSRVELLQLDMEGMLKYFQREVREKYADDHELLFHCASRVNLNSKRMKRLEKEYLSKRTKEQEEAIELRRLRTENRLLRQRIDYLEHESQALADRLVKRQVDLAQQADTCLNITHELSVLRDINSDAHRRLEDAYETIRELTDNTQRVRAEGRVADACVQVDDTSMIMHIHHLQQELNEAHTRKADLECTLRDQRVRIVELESTNKRLRECPPDGELATIQEELIRVKMREAEAALSLKEMRQRLAEVEQQWTKFMQIRGINNSSNGSEQQQKQSPRLSVVAADENATASAGECGAAADAQSSVEATKSPPEQQRRQYDDDDVDDVEPTLASLSSQQQQQQQQQPLTDDNDGVARRFGEPLVVATTQLRDEPTTNGGGDAGDGEQQQQHSPPTSSRLSSSTMSSSSATAAASATPTAAATGTLNGATPSNGSSSRSSMMVDGARTTIAKITAFMGRNGSANGDDAANSKLVDGLTQLELEDRYMGLRIREADTLAELAELHQRVMELETQNHVCTNQLKRQDKEMRRVRDERDEVARGEHDLHRTLREREQRLVALESELKEHSVMQRLKYSESLQTIAELRQQIAQLESKNAEKLARAQIRGGSVFDAGDTDSVSSSLCSPGPSSRNSGGGGGGGRGQSLGGVSTGAAAAGAAQPQQQNDGDELLADAGGGELNGDCSGNDQQTALDADVDADDDDDEADVDSMTTTTTDNENDATTVTTTHANNESWSGGGGGGGGGTVHRRGKATMTTNGGGGGARVSLTRRGSRPSINGNGTCAAAAASGKKLSNTNNNNHHQSDSGLASGVNSE